MKERNVLMYSTVLKEKVLNAINDTVEEILVAFLANRFSFIETLYVDLIKLPLRNGLSCFVYIRKLVPE